MPGIEGQFWSIGKLSKTLIDEIKRMKHLLVNNRPKKYIDANIWSITSEGYFSCSDLPSQHKIYEIYIKDEIYVKIYSSSFTGYKWFRLLQNNSLESAVLIYLTLIKAGYVLLSHDILKDLTSFKN